MASDHNQSRVVVVGASAGGVEALRALASALPGDFAAPMVVVLHLSPTGTSVMPHLLSRAGSLSATYAEDGQPLQAGHIYVAPADHHVLIEPGLIRLGQGPRENGVRPSVDPTLRSLAAAYGPRGVGVIMSGTRDDGTAGLAHLKAAGGVALVQEPEECLYDSMPPSAIAYVDVDAVLPIEQLATCLAELARPAGDRAPLGPPPPDPPDPPAEAGAGTRFACPDCGGVLFEHRVGNVSRFLCSVGHVYSAESLDSEQARQLESALWAAVRSLEDRAVLMDRMRKRSLDRGGDDPPRRYGRRADELRQRARVIRMSIEGGPGQGDVA